MKGKAIIKPVAEIVDEIAKGHQAPFEAQGRQWRGCVLYSTIYLYTKKMPDSVYQAVCDGLRARGFMVSS